MNKNTENSPKAKPKTIFVIDPMKSDRIYLSKFIKHEGFMVMSFTGIQDCFKMNNPLRPDLIIFTLRKKTQDLNKLNSIKRKFKRVDFILHLTKEVPDLNIISFQEQGFSPIHKASTPEEVREIAYELLSPETLPRRKETPHPVPYHVKDMPSTK